MFASSLGHNQRKSHKTHELFILYKSDRICKWCRIKFCNTFTQRHYLCGHFLHIPHCLPVYLSGSMATEHRCGNQARMVKRSLPVPADTLVWPCWAQTTRKSLNCVCCFSFYCLSGRNKPFWGCLHGLNFISRVNLDQIASWFQIGRTHSEKKQNER